MPDMTVINRLEAIRLHDQTQDAILETPMIAELSPLVLLAYLREARDDRRFLIDLVEKLQTTVAGLVLELNARGVDVRQL